MGEATLKITLKEEVSPREAEKRAASKKVNPTDFRQSLRPQELFAESCQGRFCLSVESIYSLLEQFAKVIGLLVIILAPITWAIKLAVDQYLKSHLNKAMVVFKQQHTRNVAVFGQLFPMLKGLSKDILMTFNYPDSLELPFGFKARMAEKYKDSVVVDRLKFDAAYDENKLFLDADVSSKFDSILEDLTCYSALFYVFDSPGHDFEEVIRKWEEASASMASKLPPESIEHKISSLETALRKRLEISSY